jgi:hypothetical protein
MFEELPSATQNHKRADSVVECRIFRMVQVVFYAEDVSVVASKIRVLKHDYVLVSVCHFPTPFAVVFRTPEL